MYSLLILSLSYMTPDYWSVDYLSPPDNAVLEVGGIGFMSDGDLVASTRRGQVWRIDNPSSADPAEATFTLICEGLHEGLGLAVIDNEIFVMQRGEISKLIDLDGDTIIDEIQTVTQDWGLSGNYHEFGFGLPADSEGNLYFSLNVGFWNPHWWHGKSKAPYRGWVLKVSPEGIVTPLAGGLRSPAGLGLLDDGTLLVTDNQGDWMPVCPVYAIKEGAFYGHPASLRWYEDQPNIELSDTQPHPEIEREHPVLWLPYQWSRSTGNVIQDKTGGPFDGQLLIAELTNGQILRAQFEEIDGVLQGACWIAHKRIGSAYHIEYGPDNTLYVGMTNRGWGGLAPGSGIARIKFNGELPLEMKNAHLVKDGFEITFTKPLLNSPVVTGNKYDYNYWWEYGSPQQHVEDLAISNVVLSEDGLTAKITIDNLESGKCVMLKLQGATSTDGTTLLHNEISYTINKMPGKEIAFVAKVVTPPIERGEEVDGWLYLTWADAFAMWENNGVELCNAELDVNNPSAFKISEGMSTLVANSGESMRTKINVSKGEIKMAYMLAEDSEAEIQLPGQTITLSNDQEGGYLGYGIWHDLVITFQEEPAKITYIGINSVETAAHITQNSGVIQPAPIIISCSKGNFAFGDVRFRSEIKTSGSSDWNAITFNKNAISSEGNAHWLEASSGDLVVSGNGVVTISNLETNNAIRFDAKINGEGTASITFGALEVDIATTGNRKTGGISGFPINTNLVDQNEWCTIEIRQSNKTTVLLNGVKIIDELAPSILGNSIRISVQDTELSIRRVFQDNGFYKDL
jgi:glucose/arabinose dehydrogenase